MKIVNVCPRCGGELQLNNGVYKCCYCNTTYEVERVNGIKEDLNAILDDVKQEKIASLRRLLWEAVHEKYQSKDKIVKIAQEIRTYLPEDVMACFYEIVNTKSVNEVNDYLNNIDTTINYDLMDLIIEYLLSIVEYGNLLTLNDLIEKTYKDNNLSLYEKYTTCLSEVSSKIEKGIYDLDLTRDVFVAYSSKDMQYVKEIVNTLENEGISCFVAMRNLRHGIGAVENYDKALERAIDNSKIFLLISTPNSRNRSCDAFSKEMPYVKKRDIDIAPPEYKHDYSKIPHKYKKPRIQYVIGTKPGTTIADKIVGEFFNGIEWCYSAIQVAEVIYKILDERIDDSEEEKIRKAQEEAERLRKELEAIKKEKEQAETQRLQKEKEFAELKQNEKANTSRKVKVFSNGNKYDGEWKNDTYDGQGTFYFADGRKYVGEFKNGAYNGQGTFYFTDGRKYVGEFKNNAYEGQGIFYGANGKKEYEGEYKNNKKDGQGTYYFANGNKYVGEFKSNTYNGQGTFYFASGNKYVGEFKNGAYNGQGTFYFASGNKYVGEFKDGAYNGQGTFYYVDGRKQVGRWKDNKYLG